MFMSMVCNKNKQLFAYFTLFEISKVYLCLTLIIYTGNTYGTSYNAPGGPKLNEAIKQLQINICRAANTNGFDGDIRAFGFYTKSFDSTSDAYDNCVAAGMTLCETSDVSDDVWPPVSSQC